MTFKTVDGKRHEYDGQSYDGEQLVEILHAPMVGECLEAMAFGGRYLLTLPILAIR